MVELSFVSGLVAVGACWLASSKEPAMGTSAALGKVKVWAASVMGEEMPCAPHIAQGEASSTAASQELAGIDPLLHPHPSLPPVRCPPAPVRGRIPPGSPACRHVMVRGDGSSLPSPLSARLPPLLGAGSETSQLMM